MKLIVLSYPEFFDKENDVLTQFFEMGLQCFHLRKYGSSELVIRQFLDSLPQQYLNRIVLHHHHHLAEDYEVSGVHFNTYTPYQNPVSNLKQSASCHSIEELEALSDKISYSFLSPIFNSISKPEYKSAFVDHFSLKQQLKSISNVEVVALGGVSADKIETASQLGFDGVAVLGAIWGNLKLKNNSAQCVHTFNELQEQCQSVLLQ